MIAKTYEINSKKAINETLDGETIIINMETGTYYSMNPAGSAIWNAIVAGTSIDISSTSVVDFLTQLVNDDLIAEIEPTNTVAPFVATDIPKLDRYDDMQEMLLADPIHDVDTMGWPKLKDST